MLNLTNVEKVNSKVTFTFILLLLLSSCSPKFQEVCMVIINDTKIQFPLSVKDAIEKLDYKYNNDFRIFESNKIILDEKIFLTTLKIKNSANASPLDSWFKTEEDLYKYNVLWVKGLIGEKFPKSKDLIQSQSNVKFSEIKKGIKDRDEIEYCIGIQKGCFTVILYRFSESTSKSTQLLIIEGIHKEEEFFQYL